MKEFLSQLKWQAVLLTRNNIITISVLVTAIYALLFYFLRDLPNVDKWLTLFILNDPAIIGLFFIAVSIIIEKKQYVIAALFVSPMDHHSYLISRVVALSVIGWLCALGMALSAAGLQFNFMHFSAGVLGICILSCLIGIFLVCYTSDFLRMLLMSIPILLLFVNLPLLNYFEVTDIRAFYYLPVQGCLNLIDASHHPETPAGEIIYGYASLLFWLPLIYVLVYRTFRARVVING